jgi:sporulation protein YlmC with PRC-barrel domain
MSKLCLVALVLGAGLGGAGPVLAQSPAPAGAAPAPAAPGQLASPFVAAAPDDMLASNLIDLEVRDSAGARIGEIEDVLLAPDHTIRAVVIAAGGYRGGNVRHVAVQPSAIQVSREPGGKFKAALPLSLDQLNAAPMFPYKSGFNND